MTTAFVLTGGGSLGAVQVGMLQELSERGVTPDLLVGTSCGALNAAWVAGHGMSSDSLTELAAVWTSLRRSDIFPVDARQVLRGLLGLSPAVTTNRKLASSSTPTPRATTSPRPRCRPTSSPPSCSAAATC